MAAKSDVLYKVNSKPKRKSNATHKPAKEMKEDDGASGNQMDTFQQQALEIREPGPDFDPSAPPQDGEEYLMHMLYERRKCPAVIAKEPKKCNMDRIAAAIEENFKDEEEPLKTIPCQVRLPTKEWKDLQLENFESSREKIVLLRLELHRHKYEQSLEPPLISDPQAWRHFCHGNPPLLKIILRFSQHTLEQLLEYICDWLRCGEEKEILQNTSTEEPIPSTSNAATNENSDETELDLVDTDAWIGTWLYATLACLHIPIEPEVHSTLRDIARVCIRLRGRVPVTAATKAVPYNLFIHLISKAFGQLDFAEFVCEA
ncbi:protein Gemin2-like [Rhagoletis pomonella]|uniref:protein Gemin2-like n=1 Tax=Rhagoletis pomonella TaxID=28610 RepID=UPI00177AF761|nr:protein Gemin2-like [Rhagoletis pomonella]